MVVFVSLLTVFTILTFLITNKGVDAGPGLNVRVFLTTVGSITGPLTGASPESFRNAVYSFRLL